MTTCYGSNGVMLAFVALVMVACFLATKTVHSFSLQPLRTLGLSGIRVARKSSWHHSLSLFALSTDLDESETVSDQQEAGDFETTSSNQHDDNTEKRKYWQVAPTYQHKQPRPLPSQLQEAMEKNVHPKESTETLGTGQFITSDWRRTWYTYQSNPDLIDPDTGYASYEITDMDGTLPTDLVGDLYRNGPGNFGFHNERVQHVLDADGLIIRISFSKNQKVTFASRFVETQAFREERAAGEFLYRGTFGTGRHGPLAHDNLGLNADPPHVPLLSRVLSNAFRTNIKNTANTHVVSFGGKVLALFEAGLPHAIDPVTLETLGEDDMGGMLPKGKLAVKPTMIPEQYTSRLFGRCGAHGTSQALSSHTTFGGMALVATGSGVGTGGDAHRVVAEWLFTRRV